MEEQTRTMVQRYIYKAKPEKVFKALTNSKELTRWFLKEAQVQLKVGGRIKMVWSDGESHESEILELEPPQLLRITWPTMGWGDTPNVDTYVIFDIIPKGKGTLLQIEHTGFGTSEEWVQYYAATYSGWTYYLLNLKSWLEHGIDLRDEISETVVKETNRKRTPHKRTVHRRK